MSGLDYYKKAIFENYADFNGRARRSEYWYFVLFNAIISLSLVSLSLISENIEFSALSQVISISFVIYILGLIIPTLAVSVRRIHDTNRSGWFYLLNIIPLGGFILLFFYIQPGTAGPNKYGPDPKGGHGKEDDSIVDNFI